MIVADPYLLLVFPNVRMPDVPRPSGLRTAPPSSSTSDDRPVVRERTCEGARGTRLTVDDAVELFTTGTDRDGIDHDRKEQVLEAADRRRAEMVGDDVTFVANLNNNVTTACNTGCLFCNFKNTAHQFESEYEGDHTALRRRRANPVQIVRTLLTGASTRSARRLDSTL